MDNKVLVEHIQKVIKNLWEEGKKFVLVMLIPIDSDLMNRKYSLLVSAKWLDNKNPKEAVDYILKLLTEQAKSNIFPGFDQIARITVINTLDPFINAITSAFKIENSVINISNCNINGIMIEKAIILESNRPLSNQEVGYVGRNDLCPCGSGKKYKKCCGR